MNATMTLKDIPRIKAGCTAKRETKGLSEIDQERLYLATRAKDVLGYAGLIADVTGETSEIVKPGKLAEALLRLDIDVLDLGKVIDYQMQEMVKATRAHIVTNLSNWAHGYFSEAGWTRTELASYVHAIPEFVLDKAVRLKEALPEVRFTVQHMRDPKADPFLVAYTSDEIYYIEAWDEPRFEGRVSRGNPSPF